MRSRGKRRKRVKIKGEEKRKRRGRRRLVGRQRRGREGEREMSERVNLLIVKALSLISARQRKKMS